MHIYGFTPHVQLTSGSATGNAAPATSASTPASLLPPENDLLYSGDPGAMVAALGVMSGKAQSKERHAERDAAASREEAAEGAKLGHMKEAAEQKLIAGVVSGSTEAVGGAIQGIAGGERAVGFNGACKGTGAATSAVFKFNADRADSAVASS